MLSLRLDRALIASVLMVAALAFAGSAQAADPQVLRIGAPLPLTGALAPEGRKLRQGYDLWLEQVKAQDGITVGA